MFLAGRRTASIQSGSGTTASGRSTAAVVLLEQIQLRQTQLRQTKTVAASASAALLEQVQAEPLLAARIAARRRGSTARLRSRCTASLRCRSAASLRCRCTALLRSRCTASLRGGSTASLRSGSTARLRSRCTALGGGCATTVVFVEHVEQASVGRVGGDATYHDGCSGREPFHLLFLLKFENVVDSHNSGATSGSHARLHHLGVSSIGCESRMTLINFSASEEWKHCVKFQCRTEHREQRRI